MTYHYGAGGYPPFGGLSEEEMAETHSHSLAQSSNTQWRPLQHGFRPQASSQPAAAFGIGARTPSASRFSPIFPTAQQQPRFAPQSQIFQHPRPFVPSNVPRLQPSQATLKAPSPDILDDDEDDLFAQIDMSAYETPRTAASNGHFPARNVEQHRLPPPKGSRQIDPRHFVPATTNPQTTHSQTTHPQTTRPQTVLQPKRPDQIRLKPVADLPDAYRSFFRFGPVFNAVQTVCFDTVYSSDRNCVVSAPTGSGKTTIFELAMLRIFELQPQGRIVYIAPTKSLCSERAKEWQDKFGKVGVTVTEVTGDSGNTSLGDLKKSHVIVSTPEKWDSLTRKWHTNAKWLGQLKLFCIDEVHLLNESRGAVLEVVVSRMRTLGDDIRFVALSATAPNIVDVAAWLSHPEGTTFPPTALPNTIGVVSVPSHHAQVFHFGEEFRPVPLKKFIYGYPKGGSQGDFQFSNSLNFKLLDLIIKHSSKKPVLVFCSTRKYVVAAAQALAKDFAKITAQNKPSPWPTSSAKAISFNDAKQQEFFSSGIGIHHAGCSMHDRKLTEELFLGGSIRVLCCTSTLAVGVNLPAHMVLIVGTKHWDGSENVEYTDIEISQMIGRAGRNISVDPYAVAVIMTEASLKDKYEKVVGSEQPLESCLHLSLTEHIVAEIDLKTVTDVGTALDWLRSTFLFIRIQANPLHYRSVASGPGNMSPDKRLEQLVIDSIDKLSSEGIVESDETTTALSTTSFGTLMSQLCISQATFIQLKNAEQNMSTRAVLELLCQANEFATYRFRAGEKQVFTKANERNEVKFPIKKISNTPDKISLLIQFVLAGIPLSDITAPGCSPATEVGAFWQHASRIMHCIVELVIAKQDAGSTRNALYLMRSISAKAWEHSAVTLRQLEGIGEKSIKALANGGIRSLTDLAGAKPSRINLLLNRNPPFGEGIVAKAQSLPQFALNITILSEKPTSAGVQVHLRVEASMKNADSKPMLRKEQSRVKLAASMLIFTSDQQWIEYRRIKVQGLAKPKSFDTVVVLIKPSQKIMGQISCDEIAGLDVMITVTPKSTRSSYPTAGGAAANDDLAPLDFEGFDDTVTAAAEQTLYDDHATADISVDATAVRGNADLQHNPTPAIRRPTKSAKHDNAVKVDVPIRLPSGKWACNHSCADKTACKHLCCREGMDKPPKKRGATTKTVPAKRKREEDNHDGSSSEDDIAIMNFDGFNDGQKKATCLKNASPILPHQLILPATKTATAALLNSDHSYNWDDFELPDADEILNHSFKSSQRTPKQIPSDALQHAQLRNYAPSSLSDRSSPLQVPKQPKLFAATSSEADRIPLSIEKPKAVSTLEKYGLSENFVDFEAIVAQEQREKAERERRLQEQNAPPPISPSDNDWQVDPEDAWMFEHMEEEN